MAVQRTYATSIKNACATVDGSARPSECTFNNYVLRKYGMRSGQFETRTRRSRRSLPEEGKERARTGARSEAAWFLPAASAVYAGQARAYGSGGG